MDGAIEVAPARYDEDFHVWAQQQAAAIRAQDWKNVDWEHLAEEVETLGASDRRELENRITTIIEHLLKLDHGRVREPENGWRQTILTQRSRIERLLNRVPSLRPSVGDIILAEYPQARRDALGSFAIYEPDADYGSVLPEASPYGADDVLGEG